MCKAVVKVVVEEISMRWEQRRKMILGNYHCSFHFKNTLSDIVHINLGGKGSKQFMAAVMMLILLLLAMVLQPLR